MAKKQNKSPQKNSKQLVTEKPAVEVKNRGKAFSILQTIKMPLWFLLGAFLGFFFFTSFLAMYYFHSHNTVIYPGVIVNGMDVGDKPPAYIQTMFEKRNEKIQQSTFTFYKDDNIATISAKELQIGYDKDLLTQQAFSVGRSGNFVTDISILLQAYMHGVHIDVPLSYNDATLSAKLAPIQQKLTVEPIDARFTFENGRVTEFRQSQDGQEVDMVALKKTLKEKALAVAPLGTPQAITIPIPVHVIHPAVTTDKVNKLGIQELVGQGTSLFHGSIENRIYNIQLAASRLNGILIPPDSVFSFDKAVGDISSLSGYKQAYVISNGKTVLGDGGGVCQVSTTFFRAILNAGYPIVERNPHAYRVHYYEEDSGPGIDAAIYTPSVDLKFKNDSGHYLLVQSTVDLAAERLTFSLYGMKDGRDVSMTDPVILSQTPAPPPLYQDDPTLPKGTVKQVDFSADGANVYFTRTVKKNGVVIITDKFTSNYRPWQAIFLRGTM